MTRQRPSAAALILCMLLAALLLCPPAQADLRKSGGLQRALDRITGAKQGPPGASILIRRGGESRYLRSGVANTANGRQMNPGLPTRIASVAKAFNGAVVLALVDRHKLRLGDTIDDVLPGVWPLAGDVTVRQMLQHRGGLPEYIRDPGFLAALMAHPRRYKTPRQILDYVDDEEPEFDPGSRYEYSDTDNITLGLMAEAVTGRSYESLLRRYVYRPAGLRRTSMPRSVAMPKRFMHGYEVAANGKAEDASKAINPALAWASGGILSTQADLGRFFRAYVGGELFGEHQRRAQVNGLVKGSSSPPGPGANRAGLGLFRYETRCGKVFGHTGSFPGYRQFAAASRNGRRSVVFTVNAQIVPGQGSERISKLIREAQVRAVCRLLK